MATVIFVSSTFLDLEEHRRLVQDAIARLEHGTRAMEFFGALANSPREECLRLVRASEVFLGIVGMRYGSLDPETGKSLSQLEYEEAIALRLPCLIYLIDEDHHPVLPRHIEFGEGASKLLAFKATLRKTHVVSTFSSASDLVAKVTQDLVRLIGAREKTATAEVLAHIAKNATVRHPLTEPRFRFLREKVVSAFKKVPPDLVLREALELILAGDNMAASFVLSRGGEMHLDDAVDGLMEVERIIGEFIREGQERIAAKAGTNASEQAGDA
jgi:hypothetical protein